MHMLNAMIVLIPAQSIALSEILSSGEKSYIFIAVTNGHNHRWAFRFCFKWNEPFNQCVAQYVHCCLRSWRRGQN